MGALWAREGCFHPKNAIGQKLTPLCPLVPGGGVRAVRIVPAVGTWGEPAPLIVTVLLYGQNKGDFTPKMP